MAGTRRPVGISVIACTCTGENSYSPHMGLPIKKRAQECRKKSKKSVLGVILDVLGVHTVTWFDIVHANMQPGGTVSLMCNK